MKRTACFFVEGIQREALQRIEFYAQDEQILRDAGYEVELVTNP